MLLSQFLLPAPNTFLPQQLKVGLVGDEDVLNRWVQCGFLAASALTVLCVTTLRPIRHRGYEIFLFVHFLFSS
jgi:ferric-chelate reductase